MSTPNNHPSDGPEVSVQSVTPGDAEPSSETVPGKPPRTTAALLAIFALVCVGLLLLLVIGEIGIFELGN